jgi:hypothetical protein
MNANTMYRIYVENITQQDGLSIPEQLAAAAFDAITCIEARGYWKGQAENSLVIEILTDDGAAVQALAEKLRSKLSQEAVLVTRTATVATLVTEPEQQMDGIVPIGDLSF